MRYLKKTFIYFLMLISGGLLLMCSFSASKNDEFKPLDLRCEYVKNPLAVNSTAPFLSWVLPLSEKMQSQQAYQILVSGTEKALKNDNGDLWDSGKVQSGRSQHLKYMGKELKSEQQVSRQRLAMPLEYP